MRPFRTFLLLLLIISSLVILSVLLAGRISLPGPADFLPATTFSIKKAPDQAPVIPLEKSIDTVIARDSSAFISHPADTAVKVISFNERLVSRIDSGIAEGRQVRILYYGDSQIEGDRVTAYMRRHLRKIYGGAGPGLFLPLMPVMYTESVYIRSSSNWKRYNYLSYKTGEYSSRALGPFMTLCRYLPPGVSGKNEKAFVRVVPSKLADSSEIRYDSLRIFYKNAGKNTRVTVRDTKDKIASDTLLSGGTLRQFTCNVKRKKEITIEFEGNSSPDILGLSIESSKGVIVDNIPQRGSAGLEFSMVDSADLSESYRLLKPDLVVLHYGLNIVRNVRKEYNYYEEGVYRQLEKVKAAFPSALLLVIGVSDMAEKSGDTIRSFPNLPLITKAQQAAAKRAGAGFWDARAAMGGENSIINWSERVPSLAGPDLVHFTNAGADTLSALMFRDLFISKAEHIPARDTTVKSDTIKVVMPLNTEKPVEKAGEETNLFRVLLKKAFTYDPANPFIFTTAGFWLFLLIVIGAYSIVYRRLRLRNIYLLLVSLYFYFKTGGLFLFLLIFVTVVDYSCALLINGAKTKGGRKFFVALSVISNLGLLAYFKYASFVTGSVNTLFGSDFRVFDLLSSTSNSILGTHFDTSFIILPVGISFFTFQSLSYTIDVYRKKMDPVKNILDFGFYVSFFPHLVAGPIVRASVFMPQVYQEYSVTKREFGHSLFMISKGLIKKIIISNFIALTFVDRVFDTPALYSGFENLMAIYGYGLQIYCDFSGYTDIAIGVALLLGFRLPVNFNSPYKASSITDFWKRWHISLSSWLRDYLYIPLGGNRKGKFRTGLNLMITMLLGGLWHGASLRFIIWGGLHGAGLVIDKIRNAIFGEKGSNKTIARLAGIFITFNFVSFCWIFFRSDSMDNIATMLRQICFSFSPGTFISLMPVYGQVLIMILTGYLLHFLPEKVKESYRGLFIRTPVAGQLVFILLLAVALWQMRTTDIMPFIYFRF